MNVETGAVVVSFVWRNLRNVRKESWRFKRSMFTAVDPTIIAEADADPSAARPESRIESEEFWAVALAGLTEPQAEAVKLYYRDGLTLEEVATEAGINNSSVYQRMARAMETMRKNLADYAPNYAREMPVDVAIPAA